MEENKTAPKRRAVVRSRIKSAQLMEVIAVSACVGSGTKQDPNRVVTEYWSKEGMLLAVSDPHITEILRSISLD